MYWAREKFPAVLVDQNPVPVFMGRINTHRWQAIGAAKLLAEIGQVQTVNVAVPIKIGKTWRKRGIATGSAKLAAEDEEIQDEIRLCLDSGMEVQACMVCTDSYGVTKKIMRLGVNVRLMGESFTEYLKGNDKLITF